MQAIKARLPSRPERVFPPRITTWGKLTPIAAAMLALVSIVELDRAPEEVNSIVDTLVAEGLDAKLDSARPNGVSLPKSTIQVTQ